MIRRTLSVIIAAVMLVSFIPAPGAVSFSASAYAENRNGSSLSIAGCMAPAEPVCIYDNTEIQICFNGVTVSGHGNDAGYAQFNFTAYNSTGRQIVVGISDFYANNCCVLSKYNYIENTVDDKTKFSVTLGPDLQQEYGINLIESVQAKLSIRVNDNGQSTVLDSIGFKFGNTCLPEEGSPVPQGETALKLKWLNVVYRGIKDCCSPDSIGEKCLDLYIRNTYEKEAMLVVEEVVVDGNKCELKDQSPVFVGPGCDFDTSCAHALVLAGNQEDIDEQAEVEFKLTVVPQNDDPSVTQRSFKSSGNRKANNTDQTDVDFSELADAMNAYFIGSSIPFKAVYNCFQLDSTYYMKTIYVVNNEGGNCAALSPSGIEGFAVRSDESIKNWAFVIFEHSDDIIRALLATYAPQASGAEIDDAFSSLTGSRKVSFRGFDFAFQDGISSEVINISVAGNDGSTVTDAGTNQGTSNGLNPVSTTGIVPETESGYDGDSDNGPYSEEIDPEKAAMINSACVEAENLRELLMTQDCNTDEERFLKSTVVLFEASSILSIQSCNRSGNNSLEQQILDEIAIWYEDYAKHDDYIELQTMITLFESSVIQAYLVFSRDYDEEYYAFVKSRLDGIQDHINYNGGYEGMCSDCTKYMIPYIELTAELERKIGKPDFADRISDVCAALSDEGYDASGYAEKADIFNRLAETYLDIIQNGRV